jgi:hypothetical protein
MSGNTVVNGQRHGNNDENWTIRSQASISSLFISPLDEEKEETRNRRRFNE